MGGNNSNRNRFPLPDNWNVDEFICAVVPIPNDPQYIATFRGLLDTLTWQRSFMLHRTEDAAFQVSKTWQAAFASRELQFIDCEGEMTTVRMRAKPGQPWIMQFSHDSGETWVDALIQPNWNGSGAGNVWPTIETIDDAAAVAGGIIAGGPQRIVQRIIDDLGNGFSRDQIINDIQAEMARFNALPEALGQVPDLVDLILDLPTPTAYTEDCTYDEFWESLSAWLNGNRNNFNQLLSDWLANHANDFADEIVQQMAHFYASWGNDAMYAQLANYNSLSKPTFGDDCDWEHVFEFSLNNGGWVATVDEFPDPVGIDAVYSAACCWQGVEASNGAHPLGIKITFPSRAITGVAALLTCDNDFMLQVFFRSIANEGAWEVLASSGGPPGGGSDLDFDFPIAPPTNCEQFHIQIGPNPNTVTNLFSFTVTGQGLNPFL